VFEAEKMLCGQQVFHRACFRCDDCRRPLDAGLANAADHGNAVFCNVCYDRRFGPKTRLKQQEVKRFVGCEHSY
jgi:cysteine/glycine-rich protein